MPNKKKPANKTAPRSKAMGNLRRERVSDKAAKSVRGGGHAKFY
jgi:hypothetical protein